MPVAEKDIQLPKLPLPDIGITFDQVCESLKPLNYADGYYHHPLHPKKFQELQDTIKCFLESSASSKIQNCLSEFYKSEKCYLDRLYLDINNHNSTTESDNREDLLPRNPFLILQPDASNDNISQEERASILCLASLKFIVALRKGKLLPDKNMNMQPYFNIFGSTRAPIFESNEVEKFDLNKPFSEEDLEDYNHDQLISSDSETTGSQSPCESRDSFSSDTDDVFNRVNSSSKKHGITQKTFPRSNHILIISKGNYYTLPVLDIDTDEIIISSMSQLSKIFRDIIIESSSSIGTIHSTGVGCLTSYSFKNWRYSRKRLQKRYPEEMLKIDSALFVVVLDHCEYDEENRIKSIYYGSNEIDPVTGLQVGSCTSRWYDKLQLVVTKKAEAAVIWDSFGCDGSTVLRFVSDIYAESVMRLAREVNGQEFSLWPFVKLKTDISGNGFDNSPQVAAKIIDWSFSNVLNTHIHLSETKLTDIIHKNDIIYERIPFGANFARMLGVRPDSLIQIAIQIAYYLLYGKPVFTYEPVCTRNFNNSRSEFITIQNQQLLQLCQLWLTSKGSHAVNSNTDENEFLLAKFQDACVNHTEAILNARKGLGFEKHFQSIQILYKSHNNFNIHFSSQEKELCNRLFNNELLTPFTEPELICSNCGNRAMNAFGVTPAVSNGFGIGYIITPEYTNLTVISQFRQGSRLLCTLSSILSNIKELLNNSKSQQAAGFNQDFYELDNILKRDNSNAALPKLSTRNSDLLLWDYEGHVKSRNVSRVNSSTKLNYVSFTPSNSEKLQTGREIDYVSINSGDKQLPSPLSPLKKKKKNVIKSKFDINFDRGKVGTKVNSGFT
ncbi:carnitine O-acetyltransferase YAT2 SCDLUD_000049 [Saccharomycodes ludwigii]|uniref:carnitine O-acetyltransferase YAT2 n=1 Tax=Saccharomycodes ludwigii TaxID=36035 RepID=UPI001E8874C4|nr:hypothetical protein SCDLUD_000049 [Saccharomycodes ludwigii]KAH3902472.1 hypothetical protein SCDLUD_000049 [Saccharomycodes ludwigii]